jgi:hypothetical protein
MWHFAIGTMTEIEIATEIATIATGTAVTTITIESTVAEMAIVTTAESIEIAMTEDIPAGTGETTGGMIAVMTAITGAGTDIAGSTGTGTGGLTKN